jgi:type II secretory pathway component HofQ
MNYKLDTIIINSGKCNEVVIDNVEKTITLDLKEVNIGQLLDILIELDQLDIAQSYNINNVSNTNTLPSTLKYVMYTGIL